MDSLWDSAELGITPRIQRKLERQKIRCGDGEGEELRAEKRGESREEWLIINSNIRMKMTGFGNPKSNKKKKYFTQSSTE